MLKRLSHTSIYVLDQNAALEFYTKKLGLEVRTDATMEGFRWLTVGVPGQPDLELALMEPKPGFIHDEDTVKQLRALVAKGAFGGGVFSTSDCNATYEELKARGVEFMAPPAQRPYGTEALFKDNSGNWFSLTQHSA